MYIWRIAIPALPSVYLPRAILERAAALLIAFYLKTMKRARDCDLSLSLVPRRVINPRHGVTRLTLSRSFSRLLRRLFAAAKCRVALITLPDRSAAHCLRPIRVKIRV